MKKTKLYNMILPPFMLFAFLPILWLISLVGNFIIDSVVVLIILAVFHKKIGFKLFAKTIIPVWSLGFIADIIGVFYLTLTAIFLNSEYHINPNNLKENILNGIYLATNHSHFDSIWAFLFILSGIFVAAIFIFFYDYVVFRLLLKDILTNKQRIIASLTMAIVTAPYTFLLPKDLFY